MFPLLTTVLPVLLAAGVRAEVPASACLQDERYSALYGDLRSHWVRWGGVGGHSIQSDARVTIASAAVLAKHGEALRAHASLKRRGLATLREWALSLDAASELRRQVEQVAADTEQHVTVLERAAASLDSGFRQQTQAGQQALQRFLRAHPDLALPWSPENDEKPEVSRAWNGDKPGETGISYEETEPMILAADAILKGRGELHGLFLEFETNSGHQPFLPRMAWHGMGVDNKERVCPAPAYGLLSGHYSAMLEGRSLDDLVRFSHLVRLVGMRPAEFSCLHLAQMPTPRVHYSAAEKRIEYDFFSRPESCWDVALKTVRGRGARTESVQPRDEEFRIVADQLLRKE